MLGLAVGWCHPDNNPHYKCEPQNAKSTESLIPTVASAHPILSVEVPAVCTLGLSQRYGMQDSSFGGSVPIQFGIL